MHQLFILFAKSLPEDQLLQQLQEAITRHQATPSEESKRHLAMCCTLIGWRFGTEEESVEEVIKKFEELKSITEAFRHHRQ